MSQSNYKCAFQAGIITSWLTIYRATEKKSVSIKKCKRIKACMFAGHFRVRK
jgi:hypothetical protein